MGEVRGRVYSKGQVGQEAGDRKKEKNYDAFCLLVAFPRVFLKMVVVLYSTYNSFFKDKKDVD